MTPYMYLYVALVSFLPLKCSRLVCDDTTFVGLSGFVSSIEMLSFSL